jgi:hypothetical protein
MDDTQSAWIIFNLSINNKFNYLCRSINPYLLLPFAPAIMEMLKDCLGHVLRNRFVDRPWDQAQLAIKQGGLGVKNIEDDCTAGYTASFQESLQHTCSVYPEIAY